MLRSRTPSDRPVRAARPEPAAPSATPGPLPAFAAIDFETADDGPDSACSLAVVRVERDDAVRETSWLIRPPRREFRFTYIHGITWQHVQSQPSFADLWQHIARQLEGVDFLAAHNAPFDRRVLESCCRAAGLRAPRLPYVCTVQVARAVWGVYPTKLPDVCRHLKLPLVHHDAASDARACAQIVLAAARTGWRPGKPPRAAAN